LDKAYDGAGSRLVRNTDLSEDEVVRLADEGNLENVEDAVTSARYTDESADVSRRVDHPDTNFENIKSAGDLAEMTASRRIAEANNARIATDLTQLSDLEDGKYVIHGLESDVVRAGDVDSMVVNKNGDTVTIERVYEVYSGDNVGKAIDKKSQLNRNILADLRGNTDQLAGGADDITVEIADGVDGTVYLPEETAKMKYERSAVPDGTVRDDIENAGYNVKTFDRTSKQFKQNYDVIAGAGETSRYISAQPRDTNRPVLDKNKGNIRIGSISS
jgi:hypothetical protein